MRKKATKLQVATSGKKKLQRQLVNTPSRTLGESQVVQSVQPAVDAPVGQVYSSESQALEVLVESLVSKLADSPQEQLEMAEFLDMVLETDPELRSQILAQTTIRK